MIISGRRALLRLSSYDEIETIVVEASFDFSRESELVEEELVFSFIIGAGVTLAQSFSQFIHGS